MEQWTPFELPEDIGYWSTGNEYADRLILALDVQSALSIIYSGDPYFPSGVSLRCVDFATQQVLTLVERKKKNVILTETKVTG